MFGTRFVSITKKPARLPTFPQKMPGMYVVHQGPGVGEHDNPAEQRADPARIMTLFVSS
jgi:hypothetical protein